jgi:hypothetical protein
MLGKSRRTGGRKGPFSPVSQKWDSGGTSKGVGTFSGLPRLLPLRVVSKLHEIYAAPRIAIMSSKLNDAQALASTLSHSEFSDVS